MPNSVKKPVSPAKSSKPKKSASKAAAAKPAELMCWAAKSKITNGIVLVCETREKCRREIDGLGYSVIRVKVTEVVKAKK